MGENTQELIKGRLVQLLDYVAHYADSKSKLLYEIPKNHYSCSQLCRLGIVKGSSDNILFSLNRVILPNVFVVPVGLESYFDLDDANYPTPNKQALQAYIDSALNQDQSSDLIRSINVAFDACLNWRKDLSIELSSAALYDKLFNWANAQLLGGLPDGGEFVAGFGLVNWRLPSGKLFNSPLITVPLEVLIDDRGMITVGYTDVAPTLELKAFLSEPQIAQSAKVRDSLLASLAETTLNFFDPLSYADIIATFISKIHPKGVVVDRVDDLQSQDYPASLLESYLYVRSRNNNIINDDVVALKADIASPDCLIVGHIAALVSESSDAVEPSVQGVAYRGRLGVLGEGVEARELYFPKPYNNEQVALIEQLDRFHAVVVHGAAGTGKTHTISNVLAHCLSQGKRVLISAKQAHVLATLVEKLPKDIRALAISRTGSSQEAKRQLDANIQDIIETLSQSNELELEAAIQSIINDINLTHAEMQRVDKGINDFAASQYSIFDVAGQEVELFPLIDEVYQDGKSLYWIDDAIPSISSSEFPLPQPMLEALIGARKNIGADLLAYKNIEFPTSDLIYTEADLSDLSAQLAGMIVRKSALAEYPFKIQFGTNMDDVLALRNMVVDAVKQFEFFSGKLNFDMSSFLVALDRSSVEMGLLKELVLGEGVSQLIEYRRVLLRKPISVPVGVRVGDACFSAIICGCRNSKPYPWYSLNLNLRKMIDSILISGYHPSQPQDWQQIEYFVRSRCDYDDFVLRWNVISKKVGFAEMPLNLDLGNGLQLIEENIAHFYAVSQFYKQVVSVIRLRCAGIFTGDLPSLITLNDLTLLEAYLGEWFELSSLLNRKADLLERKSQLCLKSYYDGSNVCQIYSDIASQSKPEQALQRYGRFLKNFARLKSQYDEYLLIKEASDCFAAVGADDLAQRILDVPVVDMLDDPVLRLDLALAWNWRLKREYVKSVADATVFEELMLHRSKCELKLSDLYTALVAKKSWLALKQSASEKTMLALNRYKISVQKIGKGTGKNAARYRRDAQEALSQIMGVIPCWIMSHDQVSETMPAEIGCFDLVIVDEASQSSIESIPVIARGKKLLVVGDNKQVSPSNVGLSVEEIDILREKYLEGQPNKSYLTPDMSLYDISFAVHQSTVMLLEHFRCHPSIIEYSNKAFYGGRIKPMRVPKKSELLTPALVSIYVEDGVRESHGQKHINRMEAQAIITEMKSLFADPRYSGRTIGVISLLGTAQAEYIQSEALNAFGAEKLMAVKFACGDASAFQGAERDIIFLTMVADKENCRPLSSLAHEQRFNVAASRARDRMYLVTSVTPESLSDKDLRKGLLLHFFDAWLKDQADAQSGDPVGLDALETDLEFSVFELLTLLGYDFKSKVRVGDYEVDFVIESDSDVRLAIECDGDKGIKDWDLSLRKQRDLERAGWVFFRCFASSFYMDRVGVQKRLVAKAHGMGIFRDRDAQKTLTKRQVARAALIDWKQRVKPEQFIAEHEGLAFPKRNK